MTLKKILSLLVAVTMLFSCVGITAMAEEGSLFVNETTNTSYDTLADALSMASADDVIVVNTNIDSIPTINKPITIKGGTNNIEVNVAITENFPDINGTVKFDNLIFNKRISTENASSSQENMTLKFVDCIFNITESTYAIQAGESSANDVLGALVVENCTFNTADSVECNNYMIFAQCVKTLEVTNCNFNGKGTTKGAIHTGEPTQYATVATITGGSINGVVRGIQVGNRVAGSTIDVSGVSFTDVTNAADDKSGAIYIHSNADADAKVAVTDCTMTDCTSAVYNDGHSDVTAIVETFTATVDNVEVSSIDANGNVVTDEEETTTAAITIQETGGTYETFAEALDAAASGNTIVLNSPDAAISAAGTVAGKTVTVTGEAIFDWSKGWLYVGRNSDAGDGTLIFKDAAITSSSKGTNTSLGIHVSGAKENDATTNYGTVKIENSHIELDYLINKNVMEVTGNGTVGNEPNLIVYNGFAVGGRPASEARGGEDGTATMDVKNGAYVQVADHNGMGIGYETEGILNVDNSKFEVTGSAGLFIDASNSSKINVSGESTLLIPAVTGEGSAYALDGAILKDSTFAGNVNIHGVVKFRGDNTFAMIYDYGAAYSTVSADWTVEPGASVTLTDTIRYGLGYGDKVTIKGELTDALSARESLTEADASFFTHGISMMDNWDEENYLTVEDAYVIIGSNSSFGTKDSYGVKGTYYVNFTNSVLDSSRITLVENGGSAEFTFNKSDVKVGVWSNLSENCSAAFTDSKMLATGSGNDYPNKNAGQLTLVSSDIEFTTGAFTNTGTITLDVNSSITAPELAGTGKIVIDAADFDGTEEVTLISADTADFTGTIDVINSVRAICKIEDGKVKIVPAVAVIGDTSYETLAEAIAAANNMTGDVTVEIYGKTEYTADTADLTGAYDSISFVGKTEDAEISITRDGSGGYISGSNQGNDCTVNFTDLILSKPTGAYANDAGFMNVYFTVYRVAEVNYTNCTFPDGACAQGCPVTYDSCDFANQTSGEYSLWVYADTETTVKNSEFTGVRGAKMYGEGAAKTGNLTMTDTVFKESVTEKPAIVLTYGESVTLSGNTYPAKGVFELDLDGAPNGTPVTSTDTITCVNDKGACGVLVDGKIYTTVAQAAEVAAEGSTVTLLHNSTETVELAEGVTLDKNGYTAAGVTVKVPEPAKINTGYISTSYVNGVSAVFGEATNVVATESFKVELYSDDVLVGTATLVDPGKVLLDGTSRSVTWHAALADDGDSWWSTEWVNDALNVNAIPNKAKLYVDGELVDEDEVQLNIDNLQNPVFAAVTDADGNVQSFVAGTGYLNVSSGENVPKYDEAFKTALNAGGNIVMLRDITLTDDIKISGKSFTLDGNGHSISNGGLWLLNGTYNISDVKFDNINVTTEGQYGVLEFTYAKANVTGCTFTNNKAKNCIAVDTNAGANGDSVVTIDDCTFSSNTCSTAVIYSAEGTTNVKNSAITGNTASIAVIYNSANCSVTGNVFSENILNGTNTNKAAILSGPWVAGEYTVSINENAFMDDDYVAVYVEDWTTQCNAVSTNDLSGNYWIDGDAPEADKDYVAQNSEAVTLDSYYTVYNETDGTLSGSVSTAGYVAQIGEQSYKTLQAAIDAACSAGGTVTVTLSADVTENVTITEKVGMYLTIDGAEKTMNGTITIKALSDTNDNRRTTIKNVKFVDKNDAASVTFIKSSESNHYPRITVDGCSFTGSGYEDDVDEDVAISLKSAYDAQIKNCSGTGLHSFLQNTSGVKINVYNVNVTDSNGGLAMGTAQDVKIRNCSITTNTYGIRLDAVLDTSATLNGNTVNAYIPVSVRNATAENYKLTFSGSTSSYTATNADGKWCAICTTEYEAGGVLNEPTGNVKITWNTDSLDKSGVYGAYEWPIEVVYDDGHTKGFDSLASAMSYYYSGSTEKTIIVHEDITEKITSIEGNITTDNPEGVTITNTYNEDNWVHCGSDFTIGEGITFNSPTAGLFVYGKNCVIEGTVNTDAYYQRYADSKLTIYEPGSLNVSTETFIVRYMDGDGDAGIYIVGDNNNDTIGLNAQVIYFYQGMISAKDANIQVGTYWQTNETDNKGSANLVLDNSVMTVSVNEHTAKATGNSTVTLTNGSSMSVAGGFEAGEAAVVTVDETSSVTKNGVSVFVAKVGGNYYTTLANAIAAAADEDTVKLLSDTSVNDSVIIDKDITLDLGGKTVSAAELSNKPVIRVIAEATVTNGTVDGTTGTNSYAFIVGNSETAGTLNIADGTYKGITSVVSITNGIANISGGEFVTDYDGEGTDYGAQYLLNCIDSAYAAGNAVYNVTGGTFAGFNPADNTAESGGADFTAEGYAALLDLNGNYVVGEAPTATVNNLGSLIVPAGDYLVYGNGVNTVDMPLNFVMQFLADQDAADMETSPYADWYGDFVITFTGLEEGGFTADNCYLAGYYGDWGWIKVPVDGMEIENGVRYPVMLGVGMGQKYDYICTEVKDFRCAMYLDEAILKDHPNIKVNLELSVVDNKNGENAAAEALVAGGDTCYKVGATEYVADDFVLKYVAEVNDKKYLSLAAAIEAAQEGDTVNLLAGTISEGTIKLPATLKNVTIKGTEGASLKDTTIMAADGNTFEYEGITFDGVVFDNSNIIVTGWRSGTEICKDWTITNCEFINFVNADNNAVVHFNVADTEAVEDLTFTNNTVSDLSGSEVAALYVTTAGTATITGNTVKNTQGNSITVHVADGTATITGNTFENWANEAESGRAVRATFAAKDAGSSIVFNNNVMIKKNAPEQFVKITGVGTNSVNIDENYWNGNSPVDEGIVNIDDGNCTVGKEVSNYYSDKELKELVTLNKLFEFYGASPVLGNSLEIDFYVAKNNFDGEGYYAVIRHDTASGIVETELPMSDWNVDGNDNYYIIEYYNITAKQITESMTVTIYDKNGVQVSVERQDGIKAYAERMLVNPDSSDELKTTLVDMLNYGAAAQKEFNYRTDMLANADLTEEQQTYASDMPAIENDRPEYDTSIFAGTSLVLRDNILMDVYFKGVTDGMYAEVTYTKHSETEAKTYTYNYDEFESSGDYKILSINTLVIADAKQMVDITIYNADGSVYAEYADSMNSYLARQLENGERESGIYGMTAKFTESSYNTLH